jgi:hypothetical protein
MDWIALIEKFIEKLLKNLKKPWFAVPIVGISLALVAFMLYFFNNVQLINFLIITILAFLVSDFLTIVFSISRTKSQPKGYTFITFFVFIFIAAFIVSLITQGIVNSISSFYSNFIVILLICILLAILVYLDMHEKFFRRGKPSKINQKGIKSLFLNFISR